MPDVFVSYKSEDRNRIESIVQLLQRRGYNVWYDQEGVRDGDDFKDRIEHALNKARCVVVVWSRNSVGQSGAYLSEWVDKEATSAHCRNVLVPIQLDQGSVANKHRSPRQAIQVCNGFGNIDRLKLELLSRDIANVIGYWGFIIEDDKELATLYQHEDLLSYPFPESDRRIAYVATKGLSGESADKIQVIKNKEDWSLSDDIRQSSSASFALWRQGKTIFSGNNARCQDLRLGIQPRLIIQYLSYENYGCTNLILDHRVNGAQSLRQRLHPSGRLDEFKKSSFGNIIGINILLVNDAGDIPLHIRSANVAVRPGQLCSSASGTFEMDDVPNRNSKLVPCPGATLRECRLNREAVEELGLPLLKQCHKTVIVGLARELARGGQLEIFVVIEGTFDRDQVHASIKSAKDSYEVDDIEFLKFGRDKTGKYFKSQIASVIDEMEERHRNSVATTLRAHLALWFRYLAENGSLV